MNLTKAAQIFRYMIGNVLDEGPHSNGKHLMRTSDRTYSLFCATDAIMTLIQ